MPSVQDWINNPLGVVDGAFAQNNSGAEWEKKVVEYFKEKLKVNGAQSWVPSLNDVPLHYLKPNSLVKFRCMIQDMFDPEFFMGVYETVDSSTNSKVLRCGKYKDVTDCGQVDFNSRNAVTSERQTFYCVPIPGESQWVKENYACSSQARVVPSTSYTPNRHKRSYEEDDEMDTQAQQENKLNSVGPPNVDSHRNVESKRLETEAPSQNNSPSRCSSNLDLNFPLPGEQGPACLVKVYEGWDGFKLNDMLEVFGILSVDPALSLMADDKEASSLLDPTESMETVEEQRAHSPPASLVPRIHMLYAQPLKHNNPLLPSAVSEDKGAFLSGVLSELTSVRSELLTYLTHIFLGDSLAAEYLILHLISSVYARRDVLPLGKFTLNVSGCPHSSPYTDQLYQIIQQLVPSSYQICMSLHNMNNQRMVPRKDYTANRLVSGTLQLASNTSLFLDETQLEQGQLDATGVRNITALGNLISWQKVDYDFNYHQMEFPCNINVLIVSEGRSLLPSDCQVHLRPALSPPNLEEYLKTVQLAQASSQLNKYRVYFTVARSLDYNISDQITKAVEEDFVEMRKDDPQSVSAEDLHRMLIVARLLSLSYGQTSLSRENWIKAKQMEMMRISRTQQQKCVNGNEP
ncbi:mini-chromosome maintenance complex-binding protein isoform X1 [Pygocentrus nattereri]|uniref:mini-chromosome maintenance complex-binding protein isoform X1 n=1 Tax=Pygocentrus nattereri TaxID=42514 RepID=UPI000814ABCF|nr:mini-chromosome maintenance complex-binding protein isoform X1 [Pygocentrus nattereri]XP_017552007.1 mini-chromosome maintenance complex-binding protein isoform X1 [Pygocentrus nattereri]